MCNVAANAVAVCCVAAWSGRHASPTNEEDC